MRFNIQVLVMLIFLAALATGCGSSSTTSSSTTSTRTIDANTSTITSVTISVMGTSETCAKLSRDTSSCQSARTALGLSGDWLSFSCNVVESLVNSSLQTVTSLSSATYVALTTEGLPDYKSNYWPTSGTYSFTANGYTVTGSFSSLYSAFSSPFPDPGSIGTQTATMYVPVNPVKASSTQTMAMGTVGMAINGVFIFDSMASNTDNIFAEAGSFDQCQGHPAGTQYHYHSEPLSISYNDNNLIGVMRDGFFIYGRKDYDGTTPGSISSVGTNKTGDMYVYGGHTGADPITNTGTTFHYHLSEWEGCYHESGSTKSADDGETNDSNNSPAGSCGGTWMDSWMLTGHGNGGVFQTIPSGLNGQTPSQSTTGQRYYYGTPGSCSGC